MPKVTFTSQAVVCIHITGEKVDHPHFLCCPKDGGLVARFLDFMLKEKIFPVYGMPRRSGAGQFFGFFADEDVARIEAWLVEQGVERTEV